MRLLQSWLEEALLSPWLDESSLSESQLEESSSTLVAQSDNDAQTFVKSEGSTLSRPV
jgi:hypothetical protein